MVPATFLAYLGGTGLNYHVTFIGCLKKTQQSVHEMYYIVIDSEGHLPLGVSVLSTSAESMSSLSWVSSWYSGVAASMPD